MAGMARIASGGSGAAAGGLRGAPVADQAALTALTARDFEKRKLLDTGAEYVFTLGATSGDFADDAGTGFWSGASAATATYTGRQRIAIWTPATPFALPQNDTTINLGVDLTNAILEVDYRPLNDNHVSTGLWRPGSSVIGQGNAGMLHWWDNSYIALRVPSAEVLSQGAFQARYVTTAMEIVEIRAYEDGENGFVVPTGKDLVTDRQLVVTSPTATPDITIIEEQPSRHFVNVTPGQELVLDSATDATVQLISGIDGLIIAQATGPNPTATFTETPVSVPVVVDLINDAGEWFATGVDGIEMHMGSANDRQGYMRFTDRTTVIDGVSWRTNTPGGEVVAALPRTAGLDTNETLRWRGSTGLNFTIIGQTQHFRFKELLTDQDYELEYTVQSGHLNNLVKVTKY